MDKLGPNAKEILLDGKKVDLATAKKALQAYLPRAGDIPVLKGDSNKAFAQLNALLKTLKKDDKVFLFTHTAHEPISGEWYTKIGVGNNWVFWDDFVKNVGQIPNQGNENEITLACCQMKEEEAEELRRKLKAQTVFYSTGVWQDMGFVPEIVEKPTEKNGFKLIIRIKMSGSFLQTPKPKK